jgi:Fe-S-cluster-containing hydrogenase component 2
MVIGLCFVKASTRGSVACPYGLIHTSQPAALRTANAPSTLFLGDKNKAWKQKCKLAVHVFGSTCCTTHPTVGLDSTVDQQNVSQIIYDPD